VVATGFVVSPDMRMIAAMGFSVGVAALAVFVRFWGRRAQNSTARLFLQVAAASVFAGMVLAAVYAIAVLRDSDVLPIPQMARTHGVLNAVGFCMCGLLGSLIELHSASD
jgi:YndJ-like protein